MDFESKFICKCGSNIYFDAETHKEVCLNKECSNFVGENIKRNTIPAKEEFEKKKQSFLLEMMKFSKEEFLNFLFTYRERMIDNCFSLIGMNINQFYAISELIMNASRLNFNGRNKSKNSFIAFVNKYVEYVDKINFFDDIINEKYALTENHILELKYLKVLDKLFDNYGLTTKERMKEGKTFQYDKIDYRNNFKENYKLGMDLVEYYKRFYRLMITINYFLNYHFRQTSFYKYSFTERDIAFLLSIFFSMKGQYSNIPTENLKEHLLANHPDEITHKEFIDKFSKCQDKIPIFLNYRNRFLFGKATMLFFIFYLIGLHSKSIIQEGKEIASSIFEDYIRTELRKSGYLVPFDEEVSISKSSFKYDVIAVSDSKKEVLLIEAKYKDIPPSSFNGKNLIKQEIYDEKGLLDISGKHNKRLSFFIEHIEEFSKLLSKRIDGYSIKAIIITKYEPLISKKDNIEILGYDEFLEKNGLIQN